MLGQIDLFFEDDGIFSVRCNHQDYELQSFVLRNARFDKIRAFDIESFGLGERNMLDIRVVQGAFNSFRVCWIWFTVSTLNFKPEIEGQSRLNLHRKRLDLQLKCGFLFSKMPKCFHNSQFLEQ